VFPSSGGAETKDQISATEFKQVVVAFLQKSRVPPTEIVTQRDVLPLVAALEAKGMVFDRQEFLEKVLDDGSSLVRLLRTPDGRKFIGATSNNTLMLDRLDRLTAERGGERMLRDLMKLPDAAKYAKLNTTPGVPDMVDFLPKSRSAKTRRVKDYKKPTGKLYTMNAVIDYLAKQVSQPRAASSRRDS